MNKSNLIIRNAKPDEFEAIGQLMVDVYSQLKGFPNRTEQPGYYMMLANIGDFTEKENTELLVAISEENIVVGGVVHFSDMANYGSGGTATTIKNASGFRLLAVDPETRSNGIGRLLCEACINRAKNLNQNELIIHSTESMKIAREMYKRLGFVRFKAIDFMQGELPVFGFKLEL